MYKIALVILFLVIFIQLPGQNIQRVRGVVLDSHSGDKIPGVSIYDNYLKRGTVSNENGEFEMSVHIDSSRIRLSHVSYDPVVLMIRDYAGGAINLFPSVTTLSEVVVTSDNTGAMFIRSALEKALEDSVKTFFSKVFYQKVSKVGNDYTCLHEIFFDASWNSFGLIQWYPTHARYAQKESLTFRYKNISMLAFNFMGTILRTNFGDRGRMPNAYYDVERHYDFEIKKYINKGSEDEVVVIRCTSKRILRDEGYFSGEISISTSDFSIVRIMGDLIGFLRFHGKSGISNKNIIRIDMNFTQRNKEAPSTFEHGTFSLIMKHKRTPISTNEIQENIRLVFYQEQETPFAHLKRIESRDDVDVIRNTPYDSAFWKNNEIILRTSLEREIIRSFEKNNYFGNYFDH